MEMEGDGKYGMRQGRKRKRGDQGESREERKREKDRERGERCVNESAICRVHFWKSFLNLTVGCFGGCETLGARAAVYTQCLRACLRRSCRIFTGCLTQCLKLGLLLCVHVTLGLY